MYPDDEGLLQTSNVCMKAAAHLIQISSVFKANTCIRRIFFEFARVAKEFQVINCFDTTPVAMATLHRHSR